MRRAPDGADVTRALDGAVALVTGAASGLGRAFVLHLRRLGARVAALDVDAAGLQQLAAECTGVPELQVFPCDVTDRAASEAAVERAAAHFGRIDWLVANAGISHHSALSQTAPQVIRRVVEVNFFGAVHVTQAALPHLVRSRGVIVAVSSVAGFSPLVARTGYAASKHALHGFFDSLRSEVSAAGVAVMLACPSFIATDIDRHALGPDGSPFRGAKALVGKPATPEAVADRIYEAARRERRLLLPGATAQLAWWLSRLTPAGYARIMTARMRR